MLLPRLTGLLALCGLLTTVTATNTAADMCVSINTDSSESGNYSIYQTQGLCTNFCREKDAAYAIVQYQYCWCSNIKPGDSYIVDDSECDTQCPGYTEWCGSKSKDLFGYMELGGTVTSTMDGSSSTTATSTSSSTTSTSAATTTTSDESTTSSTTSSESETSTSTNTPVTTTIILETSSSPLPTSATKSSTVQTTTDSAGAITTVTTIATATSTSSSKKSSSTSSTALIAGITSGISAILITAIAGLFWYKSKRRAQDAESFEGKPPGSSAGLAGASAGFSTPSRRDSRFMPTDPRMDPFTPVYSRKSSESAGSLRDEQDYSRRVHQPRVLRAVNPDPEVE